VLQPILDTVVIVALIVACVVLTVTGHDATAYLGVLGGYLGRIGTGAITKASTGG